MVGSLAASTGAKPAVYNDERAWFVFIVVTDLVSFLFLPDALVALSKFLFVLASLAPLLVTCFLFLLVGLYWWFGLAWLVCFRKSVHTEGFFW